MYLIVSKTASNIVEQNIQKIVFTCYVIFSHLNDIACDYQTTVMRERKYSSSIDILTYWTYRCVIKWNQQHFLSVFIDRRRSRSFINKFVVYKIGMVNWRWSCGRKRKRRWPAADTTTHRAGWETVTTATAFIIQTTRIVDKTWKDQQEQHHNKNKTTCVWGMVQNVMHKRITYGTHHDLLATCPMARPRPESQTQSWNVIMWFCERVSVFSVVKQGSPKLFQESFLLYFSENGFVKFVRICYCSRKQVVLRAFHFWYFVEKVLKQFCPICQDLLLFEKTPAPRTIIFLTILQNSFSIFVMICYKPQI